MKHRIVFIKLLLAVLFLAMVPTALASNTWYVDAVNGSDSNGCNTRPHACKTIGHAISLASSGDSIKVAAATYTENLTIGFSLKVIGSGAKTTIVDGGGVGLVFSISSGANVTLSGMKIRHGFSTPYGGGIGNRGTLTLSNSTVSGNVAGGGGSVHLGGGLYNEAGAKMTINNSTISGNTAANKCRYPPCFIEGGGIYNKSSGKLTINNSTISGNYAASGSAIYNIRGTVTINNTTINGNRGDGGLAADAVFGWGGSLTMSNTTVASNYGAGIVVTESGTATLQNSIVANNLVNCLGVTSNGYNLSSDSTCNFDKSGDLNNTDPMLGPLQQNGGPTKTMALLRGSPAIDAGNPSGCTDGQGHLLKTDQRGKLRPDKKSGVCDMGAFERQKD